jgi:hypothetical protein
VEVYERISPHIDILGKGRSVSINFSENLAIL